MKMTQLFDTGDYYNDMFEELKRHEGYKNDVYKDHLGYLTVGIGHLLSKEECELFDEGDIIQDETIHDLFEEDLSESIDSCFKMYERFEQLPYIIQKTLINMCFNIGETRLRKFKKMNQAVAESNWDAMADEMVDSRWYRQVGRRSKELVERVRIFSKETS